MIRMWVLARLVREEERFLKYAIRKFTENGIGKNWAVFVLEAKVKQAVFLEGRITVLAAVFG